MRSQLHLINDHGEKKVVSWEDAETAQKNLLESTGTEYYVDVDWYLSHGYMRIEDARKDFDNGTYKQRR